MTNNALATPKQTFKTKRPMMTALARVIAIGTLSATIAACGGGGGDDGNPNGSNGQQPADPTRRTETVNVVVPEGTSLSQPVEGTIETSRRILGDETVSFVVGQAAVTFAAGELQNEALARFEVVTKTDNQTITYYFSVTGENTSAKPVITAAQSLTALPIANVLQDDQRLTEIALEVQYLANEISSAEKARALAEMVTAFDDVSALTADDLGALNTALSDYQQGSIDETELANVLAVAEAAVADIGAAGEGALDTYQMTLEGLGVSLPENLAADLPLIFDDRLNRYTRFTNANLGSYNANGQWQFNASYEFLNSALTFAQAGAL